MKRIFIVLLGTACVLGPTAGFARAALVTVVDLLRNLVVAP